MNIDNNDEEISNLLNDPKKARLFLDLLEKTKSEKSLLTYTQLIWHVLHGPEDVMKTNWATQAICEHLEWVLEGEIQNLMIEVPPRMSKPVHEEEYVLCKDGYKKLKDIVVGDFVLSHTGKYNKVLEVHVQGELPCIELQTIKNTKLTTALDHPILTQDGWKEAKDIKSNEDVIISTVAEEYFDSESEITENTLINTYILLFSEILNKKAITKPQKSTVKKELVKLGYSGKTYLDALNEFKVKNNYRESFDFFINLSNKLNSYEIEYIINHFWQQFGTFSRNVQHPNDNIIKLQFKNELSSHVFKHLLFRIGIYSNLSIIPSTLPEYYKYNYNLIINNKQDLYRFQKQIDKKFDTNKIDGHIKNASSDMRTNQRKELVTKKNKIGTFKCRCLTVENDHSFLANNIAVHNSLLTSVAFPTWVWGPRNLPHKKFLLSSYGLKLSADALRKVKSILRSPIFKKHWGDIFSLDVDNAELIANSLNGQMNALAAVTGMTTGLTGNFNIADDLLKAGQSYTDEYYSKVYNWYVTAFINRLADASRDSNIIIAQRLDTRDPLGKLIDSGQGYVRLTLPMEFIPDRRCYTIKGWNDPRKEAGELLVPERFDHKWVEDKKNALKGTNQYAAQYLQDPSLSTNTIFEKEWFKITTLPPSVQIVQKIRAWDLAATVGRNNDWTVGALIGMDKQHNIYVLDIKRFQAEPSKRNLWIKQIAQKDGRRVPVCIPQDPHSGGKEVALYLKQYLKPFNVHIALARGKNKRDKQDILATYSAEKGLYIKTDVESEKPWNKILLEEFLQAPNGKHDDQIDAVYDGYKYLIDGNSKNIIKKIIAI